ncbi:MAG: hypothetical protein KDK34_22180, partial [Leptospiraceae bacterium]|nr:hypothetical protein [Leptospiraceae bacterium]
MSAYEISYVLVAVILIYRLIHNLLLYRRNPSLQFLVYFALAQAFFALYLAFALGTINVRQHSDAFLFERLENACIPFMALSFLWFFQKFHRVFSRNVSVGFSVAFIFAAILILVHPEAYQAGLEAPKHFPRLNITIYETEQPYVVVGLFLLMFFVMFRVLIKYIFEESLYRTHSRYLLIALVVLSASAILDICISLQLVHFPYTAHIGILVMVFVLEYMIYSEIKIHPEQFKQNAQGDSRPNASTASAADNKPKSEAVADAVSMKIDSAASVETAPEEMNRPIRIYTLGRLDIYSHGRHIPFRQYSRQKKLLTLLKLLILNYGRWLHREKAVEALWPDLPEKKANNNLHAVCFRLRKVLHHPDALVFTEDRLFFAPELVAVDFKALENMCRQFAEQADINPQNALQFLEHISKMYAGDFFEFDP